MMRELTVSTVWAAADTRVIIAAAVAYVFLIFLIVRSSVRREPGMAFFWVVVTVFAGPALLVWVTMSVI